jgi:hypothetical protein
VILAAGLLVLLGLGLFVAGILTGATVLYWACVAACVVAAVLLVVVRRQGSTPKAAATEPAARPTADAGTTETAASAHGTAAPDTEAPDTVSSDTLSSDTEAPDTLVSGQSAPATGATAAGTAAAAPPEQPDPGVEEVEVTDLLLVVDLTDEVLVVDEHPRYHVAECSWLAGRDTIPLPLDEARADGFTPCAVCSPDRTLAERARARRHAGSPSDGKAGQPEA